MTTARIAFRNVTRQKKRSLLLGGAIAFGVFIITLVGSFTAGLVDTANVRITELLGGHLYITGQEVSDSGRQVAVITDTGRVDRALALIEAGTESVHFRSQAFGELIFVSRATTGSIDGVDWSSEVELAESLELVTGDIGAISNPEAIFLPESMASDLGVQVGERLITRLTSITGQRTVGEFVVAGVVKDAGFPGMETAYANQEYLNGIIGMDRSEYQQVVVSLANTRMVERAATLVREDFDSQGALAGPPESIFGEDAEHMGPAGDGSAEGPMGAMGNVFSSTVASADRWEGTRFTVTTINDVMEPVMTIVNILNQVSTGLFLVLLMITMVGLLNTFRMILIERTREIGTIRAVGMQRKQVRNLFLTEAMILSVGGAVAGSVLAFLVGLVVSNIPVATQTPLAVFLDGNTFAFPVNIANVIGTLLILTVITLISAYLPARRAARLRPADALRTNY